MNNSTIQQISDERLYTMLAAGFPVRRFLTGTHVGGLNTAWRNFKRKQNVDRLRRERETNA